MLRGSLSRSYLISELAAQRTLERLSRKGESENAISVGCGSARPARFCFVHLRAAVARVASTAQTGAVAYSLRPVDWLK